MTHLSVSKTKKETVGGSKHKECKILLSELLIKRDTGKRG